MNSALLKVMISGGGTGGHIFPAIAIANALKERVKNIEILFVGAEGKMEMEKVPAAGYEIVGLPVRGFQRKNMLKNISFPFRLMQSWAKARSVVRKFRPQVVVGVGGYASGPVLGVATMKGIPTLIQEQNSYPGVTNKMLAKKVSRICVAYEGLEKYFPKEKIVLTGNPVRQNVVDLAGKKPRGIEHFVLDPEKRTLLVTGGSLGARSINKSIHAALPQFKEAGIQVVWQTGKNYIAEANEAAKEMAYDGFKVHEFIGRMDLAYAVADLVVARAGAISVSELCLVRKPAILVPLPHAAEDHQTKNAMALVTHHAAILVKDNEATEHIGKQVLELIDNKAALDKLSTNIAGLAQENSADTIANEVLNLAKA